MSCVSLRRAIEKDLVSAVTGRSGTGKVGELNDQKFESSEKAS